MNKELLKIRHQFQEEAGVTLLEAIISLGVAGILMSVGLKFLSSGKTLRDSEFSVFAYHAKENLLNTAIRDPVLCENLNILKQVTIVPAGPAPGQGRLLLGTFPSLSFERGVGPAASFMLFDTADSTEFRTTQIRLYQNLAPVGLAPPFRVPVTLEVSHQTTGSVSAHLARFAIMMSVDAAMKPTSCYLVISRRIVCEDMGWVFDATAAAGNDCRPPAA
jgi:hypothetical protein